ncbi:MAG: penicillin-binding protein, partial [Oscillospiraceae bacterium]|nr:penicillin-binding protein [Oscillospiraceae bacterium]
MEQRERRERRDQERPHTIDRKLNRTILFRTVLLMVIFGVVTFLPLFYVLWIIQVRDHDFYQDRAIQQQTRDNAVAANRGKILDVNGNVLASSGTVYDVIISPGDFRTVQENWDKNFKDDETGAVLSNKKGYYPRPEADTVAAALAEILEADYEKIRAYFDKNTKYELASSRIEREVAARVWELISEMHLSNSVYTTPTTKRYYSYGSLASHVIGFFNPNVGTGAYGLEAMYEEELAGQTGRVVTAKKGDGTEMRYSFQDYYDATDGNNITLTIDTSIQYYCERVLEKGIEMFEVQDGGFAIAMDPKTGAILAWANSPTYDLNSFRTVNDPVLLQYLETVQASLDANGEVSEEEKQSAYNAALGQMQLRQWRNRTISDTYEPGSTFKSMVLAMALEEGVISEASTFYCPGYYTVGDRDIGCSRHPPGHGSQTLTQAVQNSCNPAFMMIGQALGAEKFYDYMVDFGLLEATGIDMQGESKIDPVNAGLIWPRSRFTAPAINQNTYLATASFGQRFQITPLQLITAASAVVNGGH